MHYLLTDSVVESEGVITGNIIHVLSMCENCSWSEYIYIGLHRVNIRKSQLNNLCETLLTLCPPVGSSLID